MSNSWSSIALLLAVWLPAAGCNDETAGPKPPRVAIGGGEEAGPDREPPDEQPELLQISPGQDAASDDMLFAGWPQPQLALVISGEQLGFIEPCGCAGLENQKGGLSRRHSLIKQLAGEGWPLAPLDLGGQVRRFGAQQEIKFHITVEALRTMDYAAVAFGPDDLRLPAGEVLSDAIDQRSTFVSANVGFAGFEDATPRFRILQRGGRKLAVTAVLGEKHRQRISNDDLTFSPAEAALAEIVPQMKQQADLLVLLSHASPEESETLARRFPEFKLVVVAGGAEEPPARPAVVPETGAWLVEVGHKGMYVAVVGLFDDPKQPLRYQRVPLDKRFPQSSDMHNLLVAYQDQLRERGLEGLGLRPQPHSSGRTFVGSQVCADCHTKAYEVWSNTPHAHATETLTKLDPPRQFDPECLSCHATGWEPQKYVPYASGFMSLEKTSHLTANGCENCHGPGSAHVAAESGEVDADEMKLSQLREQMRLPYSMAKAACLKCHDLDNSPDFDFESYWPEVEHRGKD
jgi:hypothetical protein